MTWCQERAERQENLKWKEEDFYELGFTTKFLDEIDFWGFQESDRKSDYADGKSTARLVSHQNFNLIGQLDQKILAFQVRAFLVVDLMV